MSGAVEEFAPAKVNLRLDVLGKRADGYHELQMIMVKLALGDRLMLTAHDQLSMTCDDPSLPVDDKNLVIRAARLFEQQTGRSAGVRFHLEKKIPTAAGLGGGSSDAAAALRGLNRYHGAGLDQTQLEAMGARLGADVPFFIRPGHKVAKGIGEKLSSFTLDPELNLLLVNPGYPISTAEIYGKFQLTTQKKAINLPASLKGPEQAISLLFNDLESVVLREYPEIGRIKQHLNDSGCLGCLMSGSGPTVFGIFEDALLRKQIAAESRDLGWKAWVTQTLPNGF